uniref:Uncharacterized protein n=1 Tax=Rhizophora mucronata TaxID=61149 RepID=A0A2P2NKJ6_RHIMU
MLFVFFLYNFLFGSFLFFTCMLQSVAS